MSGVKPPDPAIAGRAEAPVSVTRGAMDTFIVNTVPETGPGEVNRSNLKLVDLFADERASLIACLEDGKLGGCDH